MSKRTAKIALGVCALIAICAAVALLLFCRGTRPFSSLKAENIVSARVQLYPPDVTIDVEDKEALSALLREVVIYGRDDSYTEYAGQAAIFTLQMTDGRIVEVTEYNPFTVIDGAGYRCAYQPCEDLNRFANELLRTNGK